MHIDGALTVTRRQYLQQSTTTAGIKMQEQAMVLVARDT